MLPYYKEYQEHIMRTEPSKRVYIRRLSSLESAEKNIIDMSADDIIKITELKNKKNNTIAATISALRLYLRWIYNKYNISIADILYETNKVQSCVREIQKNSPECNYFNNFSELKTVLLNMEEEYLLLKEDIVSETAYDTIYVNQKKFNAYTVFLWNQINVDDIVNMTSKDTADIIANKKIKDINLSDDEIEFLNECYKEFLTIKYDETPKSNQRRKNKIYKFRHDNIFNTDNGKYLINLKSKALGEIGKTDIRLNQNNIRKSGVFYKIHQYEMENDIVFTRTLSNCDECRKLLNVNVSNCQIYKIINDYIDYREVLERQQE